MKINKVEFTNDEIKLLTTNIALRKDFFEKEAMSNSKNIVRVRECIAASDACAKLLLVFMDTPSDLW